MFKNMVKRRFIVLLIVVALISACAPVDVTPPPPAPPIAEDAADIPQGEEVVVPVSYIRIEGKDLSSHPVCDESSGCHQAEASPEAAAIIDGITTGEGAIALTPDERQEAGRLLTQALEDGSIRSNGGRYEIKLMDGAVLAFTAILMRAPALSLPAAGAALTAPAWLPAAFVIGSITFIVLGLVYLAATSETTVKVAHTSGQIAFRLYDGSCGGSKGTFIKISGPPQGKTFRFCLDPNEAAAAAGNLGDWVQQNWTRLYEAVKNGGRTIDFPPTFPAP